MARKHGKTYIREWRKHRGKTLVQASEFVGMTHGQLSRIERGESPYNQELLEKLADYLECDAVDLIIRNPVLDGPTIWSIWEHANPGERQQIVQLAEVVTSKRDGTNE